MKLLLKSINSVIFIEYVVINQFDSLAMRKNIYSKVNLQFLIETGNQAVCITIGLNGLCYCF